MRERKIAVGLCTYRRPEQLTRCLQSLAEMAHPDNVALNVVIADNDPEGSALEIVDNFRVTSGLPVYYQVEKRRGIPFARNNVLQQAGELGTTDLAFIDDDAYADAMWLANLWSYYKNSDADVVRGFVKTVYPHGTPEWIIKGNFYQAQCFETGTLFDWAGTGNVLFDFEKIVAGQGFAFDNSFGLTGGSDHDFFRRVHDNGSIIRFVSHAVVYEVLEPERMMVAYYLKRKWRVKNSPLGAYCQGGRSRIQQIFFECKIIILVLGGLIRSMFKGKHMYVKELGSLVVHLAIIFKLCGIHITWNEYK